MSNRNVSVVFFSTMVLACGGDSTGPKPGVPAKLRALSPEKISGTVATPVDPPPSVMVTDGLGKPLAGVRVNFAVGSGSGTVTPDYVVTGDDGVARAVSWILGPYAATTITGKRSPNVLWVLEPLTGSKVTFTADAHTGPPTKVTTLVTPGDTLLSGWPVMIQVRVRDANDNIISGLTVSFTTTAGDGSFAPAKAITDTAGELSIQWTLGAPGANAAVATLPGGPPVDFAETALDPSSFTWYDIEASTLSALASSDCPGSNLETATIGLGTGGQMVARNNYYGGPVSMVMGQYAISGDSISLKTGGASETGGLTKDRITIQRLECDDDVNLVDWIYAKRGST